MVRVVLAAAALLAEMRDRIRFGIAIAAMIRMIATTISNSISEKPFCLRIEISSKIPFNLSTYHCVHELNDSLCNRMLRATPGKPRKNHKSTDSKGLMRMRHRQYR